MRYTNTLTYLLTYINGRSHVSVTLRTHEVEHVFYATLAMTRKTPAAALLRSAAERCGVLRNVRASPHRIQSQRAVSRLRCLRRVLTLFRGRYNPPTMRGTVMTFK